MVSSIGMCSLSDQHGDMGAASRASIMTKFRTPSVANNGMPLKKVLVIYDALCRTMHDVTDMPLVINFDAVSSVEAYAHHVACAAPVGNNFGRSGVIVNVLTTDEDINQLRR